MDNNQDKYNIWTTMVFGAGSPRIRKAISHFGSSQNFYEYVMSGQPIGLSPEERANIKQYPMDKVMKLIEVCGKRKVSICSLNSPGYPKLLKEIYNPPLVLYYRGDLSCLDTLSLTFVGARKITEHTSRICSKITREIGQNNITLVSGMAHGVDQCVHLNCLSGHFRTVGVLACGIEYDYPYGSQKLRAEIVYNGGAYLTEFAPKTGVIPQNFYPRNRILAGLTSGTAVFQASERSGALMTANYALAENRDVFCAVPPDRNNRAYAGVLPLLEDGATPFVCSEDILKEYRDVYIR